MWWPNERNNDRQDWDTSGALPTELTDACNQSSTSVHHIPSYSDLKWSLYRKINKPCSFFWQKLTCHFKGLVMELNITGWEKYWWTKPLNLSSGALPTIKPSGTWKWTVNTIILRIHLNNGKLILSLKRGGHKWL